MLRSSYLYLLFLVSWQSGYCQYLSNPSSPAFPWKGFFISDEAFFGLKIGYQKDRVFKKEFKNSMLELARNANQGVATLNFNDRVEVFGVVGEDKINIEKTGLLKKNSFEWGAGMKSILLSADTLFFSLAAGYLVSYLPKDFLFESNKEWQLELSLCKRIEYFTFYASGAYSKGFLKGYPEKISTSNPYILIVGGSFFTKNGFSMNGELRFFGELGLGFDFNIRL